jgi:hypothetical protein
MEGEPCLAAVEAEFARSNRLGFSGARSSTKFPDRPVSCCLGQFGAPLKQALALTSWHRLAILRKRGSALVSIWE